MVISIPLLRQKANQQDVEAMYELGRCYEQGIGMDVNLTNAYLWYAQAYSMSSHKESQIRLLFVKNKLKKVKNTDFNILDKEVNRFVAAQKGDADAQYELALDYYAGRKPLQKNLEYSVFWFVKAAMQGHPVAMCNLGMFYEDGIYFKSDRSTAIGWFEKAIEKGNISAMYNLGFIKMDTQRLSTDDYGFSLVIKAANSGHYVAMLTLGMLYEDIDASTAMSWWKKAEKCTSFSVYNQGFCYWAINIMNKSLVHLFVDDNAIIYKDYVATQIEKSSVKIKEQNALKAGGNTLYEGGLCYLQGTEGFPRSRKKAIEYYNRAANNGFEKAKFLADYLIEVGKKEVEYENQISVKDSKIQELERRIQVLEFDLCQERNLRSQSDNNLKSKQEELNKCQSRIKELENSATEMQNSIQNSQSQNSRLESEQYWRDREERSYWVNVIFTYDYGNDINHLHWGHSLGGMEKEEYYALLSNDRNLQSYVLNNFFNNRPKYIRNVSMKILGQ